MRYVGGFICYQVEGNWEIIIIEYFYLVFKYGRFMVSIMIQIHYQLHVMFK